MHSNLSLWAICFFWGELDMTPPKKYNHIFKAFKLNVMLLPWILRYPLKTNGWKIKCPFEMILFLGGKHNQTLGEVAALFLPWETAGEGHVEGTCSYKVRTFQDSSSREEADLRVFCCWSFWQKLLVSKWSKFKVSSVNKQKSKKGVIWFKCVNVA